MIPPVYCETKVMMPHPIFVMDIVNGHLHPEALRWVFVLELVSIGGKRGIDKCAKKPTDSRRPRVEKH